MINGAPHFANDNINFPQEILKLYKLRKLLSMAWQPLGISKDEAVDILQWAIDEEPYKVHISLWPKRIMDRTGIKFNPKEHTIISVLRVVAQEYRKRKPLIFPVSKN